jgi:DNA-binding response OmpR family regulator
MQTCEEPPDLIILDLNLPVLSGLDVCRELRSGAKTRQIPIIIITARAEETDEVIGLSMGADDYVTKPFSNKVLLQRVKAILYEAGWMRFGWPEAVGGLGGSPLAFSFAIGFAAATEIAVLFSGFSAGTRTTKSPQVQQTYNSRPAVCSPSSAATTNTRPTPSHSSMRAASISRRSSKSTTVMAPR